MKIKGINSIKKTEAFVPIGALSLRVIDFQNWELIEDDIVRSLLLQQMWPSLQVINFRYWKKFIENDITHVSNFKVLIYEDNYRASVF